MPKIQSFKDVIPYVTMDGSTIRELMHPVSHGNSALSLAEARISKGKRTLLHRHLKTEELYHVVSGRGEMTLGDSSFEIKAGDTICIPPEVPHRVKSLGPMSLYILCCCSPAYSHEDTELLEVDTAEEESTSEVRRNKSIEPIITWDAAFRDYRKLRSSVGLTQSKFWGAVKVTQSAGSRYENERKAPQQVDILLRLAFGAEQDAANLLADLRSDLPHDFKPSKATKVPLGSAEALMGLRKRMRMTQSDFWGLVRVTQSGGSRYEQGRSIPPPTKLLLEFVLSADGQAESQLRALRRRD